MPLACKQASDYFVGSDTYVFVSPTLLTRAAPNQTNITITTATPAVALNGTTLTVTALTRPLKAGMRLKFGNSVVQVDDDVNTGATTIPILPALSTIAIASTATIQEWVRYDSFASADLAIDSESIEIRNMGACTWRSQLRTKRMATINLDGNVQAGATDLGRAVLRQAMMSPADVRVAIAILEPDGSWFQAKCQVKSLSRTMAVDAAFTQAISLEVDGDPIYGSATDLVLA